MKTSKFIKKILKNMKENMFENKLIERVGSAKLKLSFAT